MSLPDQQEDERIRDVNFTGTVFSVGQLISTILSACMKFHVTSPSFSRFMPDWFRASISISLAILIIAFVFLCLLAFLNSFVKEGHFHRSTNIIVLYVSSSVVSFVGSFAILYAWSGMTGSDCQNNSLFDGLYLAVMTVTTVGYGDCLPQAGWSWIIAMAESLLSLIVIGALVSSIFTIINRNDRDDIITCSSPSISGLVSWRRYGRAP